MHKILVVNMNYMGDALLTTPALAALRRAYPDARIDTVVGAGAAADVLNGNPDLDAVIPRAARGSWGRIAQTYTLLREGRYTDAVILPPLPAYAAAAWLARTPNRIGQANRGMNRFLTDLRPTHAVHMADAMLDTMPVPPDARPPRRGLTVAVDEAGRQFVDRLLTEAGVEPRGPILAVNVGATRPQKRWFAESFAATLDMLSDISCVLVGAGEGDAACAAEIMQTVQRARPINLVGKTDVKQLAALLARCALLLSADSGPMHLATAVGTPVVAIFGSTDPAVTGPYDEVSRALYKSLPCAPCGNHPTCGGRYDCLREITPKEVALAVRAELREGRSISVLLVVSEPNPAEVPRSLLPPSEGRPLPKGKGQPRSGRDEAGLGSSGRGVGSSDAGAIQRILIVTKFRFIGDTLLAIPIFRAARAQWPDARIALLTGKNARVLLQNNPYLDEIIEFDPYKADKGAFAFGKLVGRLRAGRFNLCLALNRSFHSALTPWLGGVPLRAGFLSECRGPLLNRSVDYDREKSEIACYFDVLRAVAPETSINPALELWISEAERADAARRLQEAFGGVNSRNLIGIQPGASLPGKRWEAARFAQVADALLADDPEAHLVIIGGPDERVAADEMYANCAPETQRQAASFAAQLDLRGSLALISHLGLFIGNDTAVMHSAVALGVPTVSLFGPTNPRKWGNYGHGHRVLESSDGVMASIPVPEVIAAARDLRSGKASLAPAPALKV